LIRVDPQGKHVVGVLDAPPGAGARFVSAPRAVIIMTGNVPVDSCAPQPAADLDARAPSQHPVKDHEVGRVVGEAQFGLVAALDPGNLPPRDCNRQQDRSDSSSTIRMRGAETAPGRTMSLRA